jgi:hypothetical protein
MPEEKPKKKVNLPFDKAVEVLLERYGYVDFCVVARSVDGEKYGRWVAGDGQNPVGDEDRSLLLHGDMEVLQGTIIDRAKARLKSASRPA